MNEKITNYLHDHIPAIFCICMACVILSAFMYGRECGKREADHNNIKGTIQQAKRDIDEAGASISQAKVENESARNSIDRASQTVGEVRERANRSQAELAEANKLIDECLQYNRAAQNGLEDIRRTNQAE